MLRKILEEKLGKEVVVKDKVIDTTCASMLMACRDLGLLTNELYAKIVKLCKYHHT